MQGALDDNDKSQEVYTKKRDRNSLIITNFDEFIEEGDSLLQVDTTTRHGKFVSQEALPSPNGDTPAITLASFKPKIAFSHRKGVKDENTASLNQSQLSPQQLTPTRLTTYEHPLGEDRNSMNDNIAFTRKNVSRSNTINKRKSLIQPVVVPNSPNNGRVDGMSFGPSHLSPAQGGDRVFSAHKRILSNVSYHSRQSSTHSVITDSSSIANASILPNNPIVDINILLKNLASKEQELLELKQKIEGTKKQLAYEEDLFNTNKIELHELKNIVTKHLNSTNSPAFTSPIRSGTETVVLNDQNDMTIHNPKLRSFSNLAQSADFLNRDEVTDVKVENRLSFDDTVLNDNNNIPKTSINSSKDSTSRVSSWRNPLTLFNQFDQILQQEIEKKLYWDPNDQNLSNQDSDGRLNLNLGGKDIDQIPSQIFPPLNDSSDDLEFSPIQNNSQTNINGNKVASTNNVRPRSQSTGKSLWTFVSDMKSGLLGISEETENEINSPNSNRNEAVFTHESLNDNGSTTSNNHNSDYQGIRQFKTQSRSASNNVNDTNKKVNEFEDINKEVKGSDDEKGVTKTRRRNTIVEMKDF